jgi:hypothetical protein
VKCDAEEFNIAIFMAGIWFHMCVTVEEDIVILGDGRSARDRAIDGLRNAVERMARPDAEC